MARRTTLPPLTALATAALLCVGAHGAEIDTGNPDWSVRWDNTVKGSVKLRTTAADPALNDAFRQVPTGAPAPASFSFPQALNFNAGDQNFQHRGLVSERLDLLSEFDAVWRKEYGVRLSGAAWNDRLQHSKAAIAGGLSEVLDAFVFGGWRLDNGMKLTVRLGQHSLLYGESLFFGDNGIARAQGPVDIDKLLASPNAQFKEVIRPVPQVSAQLQVSPTVAVGGYYQFRWRPDRLPPAGSYFSTTNIPWGSSQPDFVNIAPTTYTLEPGAEPRPRNGGQFGLQLKWRVDETDLGFYAARYHDKSGQLYGQLATPPSPGVPFSGGSWYFAFPANIKTMGISASRSIGDFNVAGEASVRDNMPLRSTNMLYGFFPGQSTPQYATGRTAHLNLSTLATFGPSFVARESSLIAEVAWNRVLHKSDPDNELDAGRTRDATALQLIFTPVYRQVIAGLDLSVPVGLRYTLDGQSAVTVWDARHSGSANIGLEGNYLGVWQFGLTYTHFLGKAVPFVDYSPLLAGGAPIFGHGNPLADRNYVALNLRRTF